MPDICPTCHQPIGGHANAPMIVHEWCVCNACGNKQKVAAGKVCNAAVRLKDDGSAADPRTSGNCQGIMMPVEVTPVESRPVPKPARPVAGFVEPAK